MRLAHGCGVPQAQRHTTDVGFVGDVGRHDLQHHRAGESLRRRDGVVCALDHLVLRRMDARRGQGGQALGFGLCAFGQRSGGLRRLGRRRRRPREGGAEIRQRRDRAHRLGGLGEEQAAHGLQRALALRLEQGADREHLVRIVAAQVGDQRLQHRPEFLGGARRSHEADPAGISAVVEHQPGRALDQRGVVGDLAGDVHRIRRPGEGDPGADRVLRRLGHGAQIQAGIAGGVRHQHTHAAGDGEQPQRPVRGQRRQAGAGGDAEELGDIARPVHAVFAEHRVVDRVVAGQRRGVGRRCLRTDGGAPDLDDHHRLLRRPGGCQRAAQPEAVAAALHVAHDDLGVGVVRHPFHAVREVDVGLVAGGDPLRDADIALARQRVGIGAERTRLADDADVAGPHQAGIGCRSERGIHLVARVDRAQAVGAQQAHPAGARCGAEFGLEARTVAVDLCKSRAEQHDAAHPGSDGVVQR